MAGVQELGLALKGDLKAEVSLPGVCFSEIFEISDLLWEVVS
jgi:hypothetical protein